MFSITIQRAPIAVSFEVGSISEAIGILEQEDSNIRKIGSISDSLNNGDGGSGDAGGTEASGEATGVKRGRKPKDKSQPDPATATAPPPIAPPTVPDLTPNANGIPAALDRTNPAAVVNQPAPPPPPPPAAAPAAPPPSGILAGKVIAALDARAVGGDAVKKQLVDWLAGPGLGVVQPGATYDEAVAVIRLMPDDKLGAVAGGLQVA